MTRTGRVFFRSIIRSYLGLVEGIISRFRFGNVCAALAGLVLGSVLVVTNATAGGMLTTTARTSRLAGKTTADLILFRARSP